MLVNKPGVKTALVLGVGNAQVSFQGRMAVTGSHLLHQFRNAGGTARTAQAAVLRLAALHIHGHSTRVIAPVFQPLQALHQHRNNIADRDRANNSTHIRHPFV